MIEWLSSKISHCVILIKEASRGCKMLCQNLHTHPPATNHKATPRALPRRGQKNAPARGWTRGNRLFTRQYLPSEGGATRSNYILNLGCGFRVLCVCNSSPAQNPGARESPALAPGRKLRAPTRAS